MSRRFLPRRGGALHRILFGLVGCGLVLALVLLSAGLFLQHRLAAHIQRINNVFSGLTDRPPRPANGDNILVLTTDQRSTGSVIGEDTPAPSWVAHAGHADSLMVLHLDGSRRAASVISIPLGAWVSIPGHGSGRLSDALSHGGPAATVATVERLTGLRIDHLAVFDWAGFQKLTDADGGVPIAVPTPAAGKRDSITWAADGKAFSGAEALAFVDDRPGTAQAELEGIRRQEYFLHALMEDTLHQELRKEPAAAYRVLDTVSLHLSVESGWSSNDMRNLVLSLRNLRSYQIQYLTVPIDGTRRVSGAKAVRLDDSGNRSLWRAVREDKLRGWLTTHSDAMFPPGVAW